ncbi:hypothetical protein [Caulobacter sp. FWC2]|uniref:hypothetical protein n=1 Tax=Caulobacter sp. FWC2 TaxID=69664 RepID=UPI000C162490|nr:hypothetical protein [Caulobacter sp. FWC2]PIB91258.1 hypothetical protein CSW62_06525 [Caulobacter sp. FWC2]
MATITPNHEAQMRPLVLEITTGMDGPRIAFVGGAYYDTVGEFGIGKPTMQAWFWGSKAKQMLADTLAKASA